MKLRVFGVSFVNKSIGYICQKLLEILLGGLRSGNVLNDKDCKMACGGLFQIQRVAIKWREDIRRNAEHINNTSKCLSEEQCSIRVPGGCQEGARWVSGGSYDFIVEDGMPWRIALPNDYGRGHERVDEDVYCELSCLRCIWLVVVNYHTCGAYDLLLWTLMLAVHMTCCCELSCSRCIWLVVVNSHACGAYDLLLWTLMLAVHMTCCSDTRPPSYCPKCGGGPVGGKGHVGAKFCPNMCPTVSNLTTNAIRLIWQPILTTVSYLTTVSNLTTNANFDNQCIRESNRCENN